MDFFTPYLDRIIDLCKLHKVRSLHAFGSAVKGGMAPDSDVDLLVDIPLDDPYDFTKNFWALEEAFGELFSRPVDLVSERAVRNKYFTDAIDASKVKLYEA